MISKQFLRSLDWLMCSELGYFAHTCSLISGLNDGAATSRPIETHECIKFTVRTLLSAQNRTAKIDFIHVGTCLSNYFLHDLGFPFFNLTIVGFTRTC